MNISLNTTQNETQEMDFLPVYLLMRKITGLALYPLICCIGLPTNIIAILILTRKQMRNATSMMLIVLSVTDTIKILNDFLYFVSVLEMDILHFKNNEIYLELYPISHYLFNATTTACAWLTVAIGAERYTAVCIPHKCKIIWTSKRALVLAILIAAFSFAASIPYVLKYQTTVSYDVNGTQYNLVVTDFWRSGWFAPIYVWVHHSLRSIIPIVLVIILSTCIIRKMRKSRFCQGNRRISLCVLGVIACFVLCVFPDSIMSTVLNMGYYEASYCARAIREFTDFMLLLHTTLNFIIYCVINTRFKETFTSLFKSHITTATIRKRSERKNTTEPFLGTLDGVNNYPI